MAIGKTHALRGQSVQIGRGDFGVGEVRTHIAKSHVIGIENENIRAFFGGQTAERSEKQPHTK